MFNVGDKVFYVSKAHGMAPNNPLKGTKYECMGTVEEADGDALYVCWDNDRYNSYDTSDLELADLTNFPKTNPNRVFRAKKRKPWGPQS